MNGEWVVVKVDLEIFTQRPNEVGKRSVELYRLMNYCPVHQDFGFELVAAANPLRLKPPWHGQDDGLKWFLI